jgi:hypothetical protein
MPGLNNCKNVNMYCDISCLLFEIPLRVPPGDNKSFPTTQSFLLSQGLRYLIIGGGEPANNG